LSGTGVRLAWNAQKEAPQPRAGGPAAAGRGGVGVISALRVYMDEALPLDDERDLEAGIEISFWHQGGVGVGVDPFSLTP